MTTAGHLSWHDLSQEILKEVQKLKVREGKVHLQSLHTTATVLLARPGETEALTKKLNLIAPREGREYHHNDFNHRQVNMCQGECANGDSHCKAVWLPVSCSFKVAGGELILGEEIPYLLELDHQRPRRVSVLTQELGEVKLVELYFSLPVPAGPRIIDITDLAAGQLMNRGVNEGVVTLEAPEGAAIWINENEPLLFEDFEELMSRPNWPDDYGLKFPDQIRLNVWKGQVQFGTWQRILLVEWRRVQKEEKVKILFEGR